MRVCFPTETLDGLNSSVYSHFGSAPGFVIVDTESGSIQEITNGDLHHVHGTCQPLKAIGDSRIDAVAVGGIGMGALMKLQAQGIRVYRAARGSVGENIRYIVLGNLPEFDPVFSCSGHQNGCAH